MSVPRAWHPGSAHTCWTLWSVVLLLGLDLQLALPCTPQGPGCPPPQLSATKPPRRSGPWWSASLAVRSRSWMDRRMDGGQGQPRGWVSPPHLRHISLAGFTLAERALREMGQPLWGLSTVSKLQFLGSLSFLVALETRHHVRSLIKAASVGCGVAGDQVS